jgi:DUF177 domain-containing protein
MSFAPIDVRELVGHPGASRQVAVEGTLDGLAGALARVADDEPVHADLLLESVIEGILVSGRARGRWVLSCARCLREFDGAFDAPVHEMAVPRAVEEDEESYRFDPVEGLDPEQLLRDAIGVEMPFAPLCSPGCLGLCETCGGNRNLGECPGHERIDPRFAVLSELIIDPDDA